MFFFKFTVPNKNNQGERVRATKIHDKVGEGSDISGWNACSISFKGWKISEFTFLVIWADKSKSIFPMTYEQGIFTEGSAAKRVNEYMPDSSFSKRGKSYKKKSIQLKLNDYQCNSEIIINFSE